jgi:hypothetical protein
VHDTLLLCSSNVAWKSQRTIYIECYDYTLRLSIQNKTIYILQSKCTSSKITSFGSCIVLKHSKSTLANTWAFPGNILVKRNCLDRCIDGYYGNPSLGQSCRPCLCPDVPSSNQYFAHSCYQNPWSSAINCSCLQGYAGMKYSLYFPSSIPHCNLNKITCS